MKQQNRFKNRLNLVGSAILICGIALHFGYDAIKPIIFPVSLFAALACFITSRIRQRHEKPTHSLTSTQNPLITSIEQQTSDTTTSLEYAVLGTGYSKTQRQEIELIIDDLIENCISLIRIHMTVHSAAVFFPTSDGGYRIRKAFSQSEFLNRDAIIYPGVGIIGSFLKDGLKQLNLRDIISDSMTLYYYSKDAKIRSLMATPILVAGVERGVIVVDSTEPTHFTDADHDYLTALAAVLGNAVYHTYLNNEYKLKYQRLSAMSTTEKYFFQKHDVESVLDKMIEIIPFALACDRLTISLKTEESTTASIKRVYGFHTDAFSQLHFNVNDKTLMGLLYSKNICYYRDFSNDHYEVRYSATEKHEGEFKSFLAVPVGVDKCKGGILLESFSPNAFSDNNRELLLRLVTSASLAIEKIQVLETARNLATHDGLTGLYNHRQFQKLLTDEMTRASRYDDPFALVLCDIDFFKKLNDNYGHQFGDIVLAGIAKTLAESIRDGVDLACRYGGEEFSLVLVKTDKTHALETTERIRSNIAAKSYRTPHGEEIHVTMSFGIAMYKEHATMSDQLIQKADKAMYRSKDTGRNKVTMV